MVLIRNSFSRNKNRMQIAKRFLVVCAATISFTFVTRCAVADDADAQSKAREALEKRLNELQSQPAQPTPPPQTPPKPVKKPKVAAQPKPTPPPPPVAVAPPAPVAKPQPKASSFSADATAPGESDAAARARAALDNRLNQIQSQQPEAPPMQPVQPHMAATAQPAATWQPTAPAHVAVTAPEPPKPVKMNPNKGFAPLPGPASPLSAVKEQRLQELLRKYRADEITPEQYQAERARILAEP
jgi:hypothetical protein